ncbi:MAG: NAD+ synthase, partial [Verrucomicrobiota bacterium]
GVECVVGPELAFCGYPPRDLLFYRDFTEQCADTEQQLAREIGDVPFIVGNITSRHGEEGKPFYNSGIVIRNGQVIQRIHKTLMPTYDVFDEDRYFEPATTNSPVEINGKRIGVTICEDIWNDPDYWPQRLYTHNPVASLIEQGVDLIVNVSASPWHIGKEQIRVEMISKMAGKFKVPVVQANAVGGNDELIFDGHSIAINAQGKCVAMAAGFGDDQFIVDVAKSTEVVQFSDTSEDEKIYRALCLGTRDYIRKCGFSHVVLGLSGGIDSALVAAIAAEALGHQNVLGLLMPSQYSSQGSIDDALALAENLGIRTHTISIQESFDVLLNQLEPVFEGQAVDVTEENIQARIRGLMVMAVSNKTGRLALTTGNKSELAAGYCTLYGDMCGGLAVINDLPKTRVFRLCEYLNREHEVIPWNTIRKPPSAELRPDQKDEDSLPPYDQLDQVLEGYVVDNRTIDELKTSGLNEEMIRDLVQKVVINEYKRRQAAPGLKITGKAFGVGRRIPIAQKFRHT